MTTNPEPELDVRLDLTMKPQGSIDFGVRALGLKPYLLLEIDAADDALVLSVQTGGPMLDDLDGLQQAVDLLKATVDAAVLQDTASKLAEEAAA